jgi:gliding motility-associated-like protein
VVVDRPRPGITYPIQYAVTNLPLVLQARQLGETFLWTPGVNLSTRTDYSPTFKGNTDQSYLVEIKTSSGCVIVDTQVVKTVKNVEIYVPAAFTPNADNKNDFLRPILMGIRELRYFKIFNRLGQVLYESRTDSPGWDGTFNGIKQATQTVVWIVEGIGIDGAVHARKGTSVLIR